MKSVFVKDFFTLTLLGNSHIKKRRIISLRRISDTKEQSQRHRHLQHVMESNWSHSRWRLYNKHVITCQGESGAPRSDPTSIYQPTGLREPWPPVITGLSFTVSCSHDFICFMKMTGRRVQRHETWATSGSVQVIHVQPGLVWFHWCRVFFSHDSNVSVQIWGGISQDNTHQTVLGLMSWTDPGLRTLTVPWL